MNFDLPNNSTGQNFKLTIQCLLNVLIRIKCNWGIELLVHKSSLYGRHFSLLYFLLSIYFTNKQIKFAVISINILFFTEDKLNYSTVSYFG